MSFPTVDAATAALTTCSRLKPSSVSRQDRGRFDARLGAVVGQGDAQPFGG